MSHIFVTVISSEEDKMLILAFQIQINGKIIYILIIFVFLLYFLGKIIRQLSLSSP